VRNAFSADVCEWFWLWIESYIREFRESKIYNIKYIVYFAFTEFSARKEEFSRNSSFLAAIHYYVAFPLADILFITKDPLLVPFWVFLQRKQQQIIHIGLTKSWFIYNA
jgi:hypothetical protein